MKIAVLIPCYNEKETISKVVTDFRRSLPESEIWVYDNNSTDGSAELAKAAGAHVRSVAQQGKGHVVRRMFREVEADIYVMVDADDTYPADEVMKLVEPIAEGRADMVNGDRLSSTYYEQNTRVGHGFGNKLVCFLIQHLWGFTVKDVMSGYRAFSRFYVKTCPVLSTGFEIETEMTLHTIDKRMALMEVPVSYRDRPAGSVSKLNTVSDGWRVLRTIFRFLRLYRPLAFYTGVSLLLIGLAALLFWPIGMEYLRTGLVPRQPTLIVSGCLGLAALLFFICGLLLDTMKSLGAQMFEMAVMSGGASTRVG